MRPCLLNGRRRSLFALSLLMCLATATAARAEDESSDRPSLQTIYGTPTPGETATLTAVGDVTDIQTLWIDADAAVRSAFAADEPGNGRATFEVTLGEQAAVGIVAVRAVGERGVSEPLLIMIDDLPDATRSGNIHEPEQAQAIDLPIAIDTHARNNRLHHYRFRAQAGRRITIDVVAQRLGSRLDPIVRVLDEDGRMIASGDDAVGLEGDVRISHTFQCDGEYLIELRDIMYNGGPDHRYRLRVGHLPRGLTAVPPAIAAGEAADVTLLDATGHDPPDALPPQAVEADAARSRIRISARGEGHDGSAYAAVRVADQPHLHLIPPADPPGRNAEDATSIEPGTVAVAGFNVPDRPHYYRIEVSEGRRLRFAFETQSLQSPANVLPRLFDSDGNRVAQPDEPGWPELSLTHTFDEAGVYHLRVDELHYATGPGHVYRLEVIDNPPRFELTTDRDTLYATAGEGVAVPVNIERDGYNGPIHLALAADGDLPLELRDARIAEEAEEAEATLTVAADAPSGLHWIKLHGEAEGEAASPVSLSTRPAMQDRWEGLRHVPAELDGRIALYIFPAPEEAEAAEDEQAGEKESEDQDEDEPAVADEDDAEAADD